MQNILQPGSGQNAGLTKLPSRANPDPEENDRRLLASLPLSVRLSLVPQHREIVDPVHGWDEVLISWRLVNPIGEEDRIAAIAKVDAALAPATAKEVAHELALLRAKTIVRKEDQSDLNVLAMAYTEELVAYPPDIVAYACRMWARNGKWWPAWSELREILDRAVRPRQAILEALLRGNAPSLAASE